VTSSSRALALSQLLKLLYSGHSLSRSSLCLIEPKGVLFSSSRENSLFFWVPDHWPLCLYGPQMFSSPVPAVQSREFTARRCSSSCSVIPVCFSNVVFFYGLTSFLVFDLNLEPPLSPPELEESGCSPGFVHCSFSLLILRKFFDGLRSWRMGRGEELFVSPSAGPPLPRRVTSSPQSWRPNPWALEELLS